MNFLQLKWTFWRVSEPRNYSLGNAPDHTRSKEPTDSPPASHLEQLTPMDVVSPEGFRVDGRRPRELRRINASLSVFAQADGSAYIEQGNTKCLVSVYGPKEPSRRSDQLPDRASLHVEYNVATFSAGERKSKRTRDRRLWEAAQHIQGVYESVVMTQLFPRSEIEIHIQILQTDGGMRVGSMHVAMNAVTLALVDAGIPMSDYVAACSAGYGSDTPILDLNYTEETVCAVPSITVATLAKSQGVLMVGLESRLHMDLLEPVMTLATDGCAQIAEVLDTVVRDTLKTRGQGIL